MTLEAFTDWLEATAAATAIRESDNLFPLLECTHVLAIALVLGTVAFIDLRLLGLAGRDRRVSRLTAELLPYTWAAFVIAATSGGLLFSSNASKYLGNVFFVTKMCLIALAGINMVVFHFTTQRSIDRWDALPQLPRAAKLAGAISLALWLGVVTCGRWIGFTMLRG